MTDREYTDILTAYDRATNMLNERFDAEVSELRARLWRIITNPNLQTTP